MRLIDADILLGYVNKYDRGQPVGKALRAMLEKSPTVDAVPVVRCRDCRYYVPFDSSIPYDCFVGMIDAMPEDYCSRAVRKEE